LNLDFPRQCKFLIEQLEQGKSETLTAYLGAMAHFHNYSALSWAKHNSDYISLYQGNAELLTYSLTVIQQASATILDAFLAEEQHAELSKAS
jgi:hypothetical protein